MTLNFPIDLISCRATKAKLGYCFRDEMVSEENRRVYPVNK